MNKNELMKLLANAFLNAFRAVLASNVGVNTKSNRNTLVGSEMAKQARVNSIDDNGDILVNLMVNDYIQYIESGRRKGAKFPPVEPIVAWCKKNNIPTDNSTVFLIRRAISRDGIPARNIFNYVWQDIDAQFDSIYFDKIFDMIINELNEYFNK